MQDFQYQILDDIFEENSDFERFKIIVFQLNPEKRKYYISLANNIKIVEETQFITLYRHEDVVSSQELLRRQQHEPSYFRNVVPYFPKLTSTINLTKELMRLFGEQNQNIIEALRA